jgi:hypothetical protein
MDIVSVLIGALSLGITCFGIGYEMGKDAEKRSKK